MGIETQTDLARERSDSIAIDDMCITDADYPVGDLMVAMLAFYASASDWNSDCADVCLPSYAANCIKRYLDQFPLAKTVEERDFIVGSIGWHIVHAAIEYSEEHFDG